MTDSITRTVSARLAGVGAVPRAQDLYTGWGTDFYDRLVGPDRSEIREMLALARRTVGPILDVAAGSGRLTIPLVKSGNRVTAIDISDDMLTHLRNALPGHAGLECIAADMRHFSLERRFGLAILGATSITLLDREGRSHLYECVRGHLAEGALFALTVAGGAAAEGLRAAVDREICVPGPAGDETYLYSQQIERGGEVRLVNWVRVADIAVGHTVPVLTSRLQVLSAEKIARELVDAGFSEPTVSPVRTQSGMEILLLTASSEGPRKEAVGVGL
ncbi:daptide-type RiPP biosynthesis methyltransferase [Microbacterium sp. XT11]|uniref:daptide-type RiPP biosynthesis methyltransferase n=1 Tax=Microbacterium sp. XT11 TaxID=367477 RepID=UPI0007430A1B|nr:daptide-type RiPP biosynthesis methyltransferase [Microbacterium sp. XT11]ALX65546.1 hypothetical protein AB663_000063 [Microbacterium sp. XT11]